MMGATAERIRYRPLAIFDVRDHFRERERGDGLAACVVGPVRFAVRTIHSPLGRFDPSDWVLRTRRTRSGLAVFDNEIIAGTRPAVVTTLAPSVTDVDIRVESPLFQPEDMTFQPGTGQRLQIDLQPAVTYPFDGISSRPGRVGQSLVRGGIFDEAGRGIPAATVAAPGSRFSYRTGDNGAWVIVLPDDLNWQSVPHPTLVLDITVQLTPTDRWRRAQVLPDPTRVQQWTQNGLLLTWNATVNGGVTTSIPDLRLRLT